MYQKIMDKEKFFAIFGKLALVLIFFSLVGGGAYYLGIKKSNPKTVPSPTPSSTVVSPTLKGEQTSNLTPTLKPTVNNELVQKIQAGVGDYTFTAEIPSPEWTVLATSDPSTQTSETTITKGQYRIVLRQAPRGVGACGYPDAPATSTNPEFESPPIINTYVQFTGASGEIFRRNEGSPNSSSGKTISGICQKQDAENFYLNYTRFGEIYYEAPLNNPDNTMLEEMDVIVATFKRKS